MKARTLRCQSVKTMPSSVLPCREVGAVDCGLLSGLFLLLGCFCILGVPFLWEYLSCWVPLVLCISYWLLNGTLSLLSVFFSLSLSYQP